MKTLCVSFDDESGCVLIKWKPFALFLCWLLSARVQCVILDFRWVESKAGLKRERMKHDVIV